MRRALSLSLLLALAACSAAAQTPPPAHTPRVAAASPSEIAALVRKSPYYPALLEYDRQIATLRALARVGALGNVRDAALHGASLVRAQAAHASSVAGALAVHAAPYASRESAFDAATVESQIERTYRNEAALVRGGAQNAQAPYGRALDAQVNAQSASLASALDRRVRDAYGARVQYYTERENDAEVKREEAVADRQLRLRIKLAALAQTSSQRRALQSQLDAIDRSLAAADAADRSRDAGKLAAYRQSLEAAASAEYDATVVALRRKAGANWQLRRRVTNAQVTAPSTIALPFGRPFATAMQTGAASLQALQAGAAADTAQTRSDYAASAADIAGRFTSIGSADANDQAQFTAELAAMERARAALYDAIVASLKR